ncbi:MAG: RNA polymerase sigma factor [Planctomycetes bacterium]|nr:RNA polymerase sigma factor [Planctomycetota bacterium]
MTNSIRSHLLRTPQQRCPPKRGRVIAAYFVHQGASPCRAEDLTQEVFVKLYRCAARYRPQERFSSFCFRVARNVWIDDCRKASSRVGNMREAQLEDMSYSSDSPQTYALEEEQLRVGELLARLPTAHRQVFELVLLGELSYEEIGELLSIPLGTVKSRMFQAVRSLRRAWAERLRREGVA